MTAIELPWPLVGDSPLLPTIRLSEKSSPTVDMSSWSTTTNSIDESSYNTAVLQLGSTGSEDDLDDKVALEAQALGLFPLQITSDINGITSSLSTATIASDSLPECSTQSPSPPLSRTSNDLTPGTQYSQGLERSSTGSDLPSILSEVEKKRNSPLRRGFRKMAGLRKKRPSAIASSTLTSISSDGEAYNSEDLSMDIQSPSSIKSSKSSWSQPLSATKFTHDPPDPVDSEALIRSVESKELLNLRMAQLDEKVRFLEFQTTLISELRSQREAVKGQKSAVHEHIITEQTKKNERAVETLEARQLEDEMKMVQEHEVEKRTVMLRLRHMEAYCQNPSPPPTPVDTASGRPSSDSPLPERKVTDRDYHSLAQQYRERDAMDNLHSAKINVLRGKQKKAVENLMARKERELDNLRKEQKKELAAIDRDFAGQEANLRLALGVKRARLESRWRTQALIERTKLEKVTGLKYAALPDVVAIEDPQVPAGPTT